MGVGEVGVGADGDLRAVTSHWAGEEEAVKHFTFGEVEDLGRRVAVAFAVGDVEVLVTVEEEEVVSCELQTGVKIADEGHPLGNITQWGPQPIV